MTKAVLLDDYVDAACKRAGERLAEAAFRDFGDKATQANLFTLEFLAHGPSDAVLDMLEASDNHRLLAKILIGHALRRRYEELVRASDQVQQLKDKSL